MGKDKKENKLKAKKPNFFTTLRKELRAKKGIGILYFVLRAFVIGSMIFEIANKRYENAGLCILTLILFLAPTFVEDTFKIDFPTMFEVIILLFIFSAEILGEINAFYTRFPGWDTVLHTLNGFNCAAVGFALVDFFNRNKHFSMKLSPLYLAISAFCFSMTVGVLWEFFEFTMDYFFALDMQKDFVVTTIGSVSLDPTGLNKVVRIKDITDVIVVQADGTETALGLGGYLDLGIIDTMKDLIVNFIGAVVFSIVGVIYVKNRDKKQGRVAKLTEGLIPIVLDDGQEANKKTTDTENVIKGEE